MLLINLILLNSKLKKKETWNSLRVTLDEIFKIRSLNSFSKKMKMDNYPFFKLTINMFSILNNLWINK